MTNPYFTKSGTPSSHAPGASSPIRAEIAAIEAGFDKLPTLSGNALKLIRVNAGANGLEAIGTIDAIPIGATTPSTGAFTTLSASGGITGNLTGTVTGNVTGNATTATTLQTARNINGVAFNGSADITVTAAAGTLTGAALAAGVTASSLTSLGTLGSLSVTGGVTAASFSGSGAGLTTLNASNLSSGSVALARLTLLTDVLADPSGASNGDALSGVKWIGPNSAAPGVATTQHQINEDSATVMSTIADSLKAAIRELTSTVDMSSVLQAYWQYCYNNNVPVVFPAGQFSSSPFVITVDGGNFDKGMKVTGAGQNVTRIKKLGSSSSPLITIQTASPTTDAPKSIQLMMRDLTLDCVNETGPGLALAAIAVFHIENVGITDSTVGIDLQSSLIGTIQKNKIVSNQVGIRSRKTGVAYCNQLTLRDNQITNNTVLGLDIGACDSLNLYDNQIEANGAAQATATVTISNATPAVVTWNAHGRAAEDPIVLTTSGTLPTGLVVNYCYYVSATGLTANTLQLSATPGGASVATTGAGSGTHTAASAPKGGIVIRDTCIDELGYCVLNLRGNRCEANLGVDIRTEYMSSAFGAILNIDIGQMAGTSDGPMILVGYMRKVSISNAWACVGSSTWNICCEQGQLENIEVINLLRPRVQPSDGRAYWTITNARFGGTDHVSGEKVSWTATLTGCTTSPTGTVQTTIQGKCMTHFISTTIQGTSNTTSATLTGMPPDMWPLTASTQSLWARDNGTNDIIGRSSVGTNGVISLGNGNSSVFTSSGNKGVASNTFSYEA